MKRQAAAELLTLRRDAIRMIDGAGPDVEVGPPEQEQGSVTQAEPGVEPAPAPPRRRRKKTEANVLEDDETRVNAPSQDGSSEASSGLVDVSGAVSPTKPKRGRRVGEPKPKRYAVGEKATEHQT